MMRRYYLMIILLLVALPGVHAQEFEFYYPDEPLPAEEEYPMDDAGVETEGIIPRIVSFFRNLTARDEDEDIFVLEEPVEETAPAVSVDPNDPEKKPRGTILFGWRW